LFECSRQVGEQFLFDAKHRAILRGALARRQAGLSVPPPILVRAKLWRLRHARAWWSAVGRCGRLGGMLQCERGALPC
jgi:hypothetical protein